MNPQPPIDLKARHVYGGNYAELRRCLTIYSSANILQTQNQTLFTVRIVGIKRDPDVTITSTIAVGVCNRNLFNSMIQPNVPVSIFNLQIPVLVAIGVINMEILFLIAAICQRLSLTIAVVEVLAVDVAGMPDEVILIANAMIVEIKLIIHDINYLLGLRHLHQHVNLTILQLYPF